MSSETESLKVSRQNVAGALASLLSEFEATSKMFIDKIPAMIRPMIEDALGQGVFKDKDGSMGERLWLYLEREVLRENNGHGSA